MNKYINIPYKNLGRDFSGVDCYGLVWLIYKTERNIILPDFTELKYDKQWYKEKENHILDNMWDSWKEVQQPFNKWDCVLFYMEKNIVNHIGMIIEGDKFIHTNEKFNSNIGRLNRFYLSRLYKGLRYCG